jgi:DNA-binding transcriptional MerR regulator
MVGLTISRFAAVGGVGVETVRCYQRRGLLAVPERHGTGYREYSEADQQRLAFIGRARELGFTLAEIADLLGPAETGFTDDILKAARAKLEYIRRAARRSRREVRGGRSGRLAAALGLLPLFLPSEGGEIEEVVGAPG